MEAIAILAVVAMGIAWGIDISRTNKRLELMRDALRRAENDALHANDSREVAEAQLRHKTALNTRLVERLTHLGDTDEAMWSEHSKTLRRFSDKFDKGTGKPLPFPELYS